MRALGLFRPHRRSAALLVIAIVSAAAIAIALPLLTKEIFDSALFPESGEPQYRLLAGLVAVMIALAVVGGAISIAQTYLTSRIGQRVMHDLRNQLYEHLQGMSLRFFTSTRTGELQARIAHDAGGAGTIVTDSLASILSNSVFVVGSLIAMAILSWPLMLLSLAILPGFVLITHHVGRTRRRLSSSTQRSLAELSVITQETLSVSGMLLARLFGRHQDSARRYRAESERLVELRVRQEMTGRVLLGLAQTFVVVAPVIAYLVAGFVMAGGGELTAGTLVAFVALQTRLFFPFRDLMETSIEMYSSLALFERVFEYLDLAPEIVDRPGAQRLEKEQVRGAVAFRNVYFRYPVAAQGAAGSESRPVRDWTLENVSLQIEPGQLAAIVGPSGAGKTTMSYLVPRLYDVTEGAVEIDGVDVRDIQLDSLAEIIGIVTQETYLFHASIEDNLRYARPEATIDEIELAARAAAIHERIVELDDGYDTIVGERGYRMSGGEKQRLAIARVILKNPRIVFLDEATSSLDTTSERLVQRALEPLLSGRTTIAIAHRLSTIRAADVIFVLDQGRLVEQGTHSELIDRGGLYALLYEQQFHAGLVEARCSDGFVLTSGGVMAVADDVA
jgi:ATP-binding cassette subfamily B protein